MEFLEDPLTSSSGGLFSSRTSIIAQIILRSSCFDNSPSWSLSKILKQTETRGKVDEIKSSYSVVYAYVREQWLI